MFQGTEWQRNQDLLDRLRAMSVRDGRTVAELVIAWTIEQPGITVALCGAKRPDQIRESAGALSFSLTPHQRAEIDAALAERGRPASRAAVT
jgi:aryl-alcohol dehydrogenase-like predicted oxidoreductase